MLDYGHLCKIHDYTRSTLTPFSIPSIYSLDEVAKPIFPMFLTNTEDKCYLHNNHGGIVGSQCFQHLPG